MIQFRKKIFSAAIDDEVLLSMQAISIIKDYQKPLRQHDLLLLSKLHGIDLATRCYYESLLQSEHGAFKKLIDSYNVSIDVNSADKQHAIKILVVPGMFYKEHPEVGADGQLIVSIARQCGFDAEVLPIKSKGSITDNVSIINEALQQEKADKIWLLSLSKGSSEVRHYLQSYQVPQAVKGWLNIAGINNGSPHADRKLSSSLRKTLYLLLTRLMKVDFQVLKELNTNHAMWGIDEWDNSINYIHVAPIPLRAHLRSMLRRRYEKILQFGPNDGIVPVADVNVLPGKIYPVWGVDHFMRTPQISELLYKFFTYIAQQEHS